MQRLRSDHGRNRPRPFPLQSLLTEDRVMEEVRTATPRCGMGGLVNEIVPVLRSDIGRAFFYCVTISGHGVGVGVMLLSLFFIPVSIPRRDLLWPHWGCAHDGNIKVKKTIKTRNLLGSVSTRCHDHFDILACPFAEPSASAPRGRLRRAAEQQSGVC